MGFSEETYGRAREIIARYPADRSRSALLPLLHLVQSEEGYVSPAGVTFCAEVLGLNKAQVGAVATFYTMYKRRPTGDWLVSVCTNTMCNVLGGQQVYDTLSEHLGVGHDETTSDGSITLEHAECLAACDYGPVMTVNYDFFDQVDPDSAVGVVNELRAGNRPAPSRGARLCTLKEMSLQLAGFSDEREGAVADGVAGDPTLRGLRLAEQHGISVKGFDPNTPIKRKQDAAPAPATTRPAAATGSTAPDVPAPDQKSPQLRTAETRAPDAKTPAPDAPGVATPVDGEPPAPADAQAAAAAGTATNPPASDGKPAGDDAEQQQRSLKEAQS
ncbi:NADH dehydrogenase subunit E [Micromonospora pisi]|uniref:NADH dehydrogenase subunit E n=2 Tax=Micromonospora pisi TaxID=589240 RepID=A0A495JL92_9ACTN|nr:NADH dehydrogenase subunit E [Micromonospora pisi]